MTYGHYPSSMRKNVGDRLPKFTEEESKMLKGSLDFLGVNYYTTNYASPLLSVNKVNLSFTTDNHAALTSEFTNLNYTCINTSAIHNTQIKLKPYL